MYNRIFKRCLVISGQIFHKHNYSIGKSNIGIASALLSDKNIDNQGIHYFNNVGYCTNVTQTLSKNELAQQKIDEYLLNPENQKHWKILQLEIEVLRQNGNPVPDDLKPKHWYELICLDSRSKRRRYLEFLFGIERKNENRIEKKRVKREERENNPTEKDGEIDELAYRLGRNSPFLRFYDSTMNQTNNWRLIRAIMFGQKIVMDCSYEEHMSRGELKNTARQMMLTFAANRDHLDPFDLHFCNLNPNGLLHSEFHAFIPTMYEPDFPVNATNKSYLELFDKNQLVYLTPDCHNELKEFDPDAIYIIGALVDKVGGKPLSLAKAKKEGLKMAKLPIDRYLHFGGGGGKSLTLNQMISIMLDIRSTNDWQYALRHVPRRKLFVSRQKQMEKRVDNFRKRNEQQAQLFSSSQPQDFTMKARKKNLSE